MSAGDLHDSVHYSRPPQDLLRQRLHRRDLERGSEQVGVVHHRDGKSVANARPRVGRLRFRPTFNERLVPGDPHPIDLDRVSIPGCHSRLGHRVVCERERKRVVQVLSYDVYCADGMHKAHGDPAPERGVCAGPRVAHTDDPRCSGNAVHDETPVTVDDAAHRQYVGNRLTIEPVEVQRARGDESCPVLGIAQLLQRRVARGDDHGHGPAARIAREREE